MRGHLRKQSEYIGKWNRRYFVLDEEERRLSYYDALALPADCA